MGFRIAPPLWHAPALLLHVLRQQYYTVTKVHRLSRLVASNMAAQDAEQRVGLQRLVAETVDVERETALVVGGDNVLLRVLLHTLGMQCCLNGVLSQWFVSQFGEVDASYLIFFLGCKRDKNSKPPTRPLSNHLHTADEAITKLVCWASPG